MQGFDEFMNLVVDDAFEVKQPTKNDPDESRRPLGMTARHNINYETNAQTDTGPGQILLKGDNVSLIQTLS